MSSEMRVTDAMVDSAVRVAIEWDGADAISPQVMRAALHAALLARTEAGAKCDHAWQPDSDVMNARYCPKCDVTQTIPKKTTHPQDASWDAEEVICEHSGCGHGPQANQVPVTLWPGDKVLMRRGRLGAAMQAKEAK